MANKLLGLKSSNMFNNLIAYLCVPISDKKIEWIVDQTMPQGWKMMERKNLAKKA